MKTDELSFPSKSKKPIQQANMEILAKQLADYIDGGFISAKVVKAFCDTIYDEAKELDKSRKRKREKREE